MTKEGVVIVSAVRTPIGSFNGSLKNIGSVKLGAITIKELISRANIDVNLVDEVIMGNVLQAGLGQNPARQAALQAGLPLEIPAMTINKVCGSGLKAVHIGFQAIMSGDADVIIAGGMENMTQAPYLSRNAREGFRMGDQKFIDSMINDGLWCAYNDYHMGMTAENIAQQYCLTREQQDEFASWSQQKAGEAIKKGKFNDEIVPVIIPQTKANPLIFDTDEYVRVETTADKLSKLNPAFKRDGTVTAGNASGINDGAAALLIMSAQKAKELEIEPLAVIRANASAAVNPNVMGLGPIPASKKALEKAKLTIKDINLIEANEAFAAQALAVGQEMEFSRDILNVNGGAIALGHPIGASGARILVTLIYELRRRDENLGLATLCIGGGQGVTTIIEKGY